MGVELGGILRKVFGLLATTLPEFVLLLKASVSRSRLARLILLLLDALFAVGLFVAVEAFSSRLLISTLRRCKLLRLSCAYWCQDTYVWWLVRCSPLFALLLLLLWLLLWWLLLLLLPGFVALFFGYCWVPVGWAVVVEIAVKAAAAATAAAANMVVDLDSAVLSFLSVLFEIRLKIVVSGWRRRSRSY